MLQGRARGESVTLKVYLWHESRRRFLLSIAGCQLWGFPWPATGKGKVVKCNFLLTKNALFSLKSTHTAYHIRQNTQRLTNTQWQIASQRFWTTHSRIFIACKNVTKTSKCKTLLWPRPTNFWKISVSASSGWFHCINAKNHARH